jgi:hypothetical protein
MYGVIVYANERGSLNITETKSLREEAGEWYFADIPEWLMPGPGWYKYTTKKFHGGSVCAKPFLDDPNTLLFFVADCLDQMDAFRLGFTAGVNSQFLLNNRSLLTAVSAN